LRTRRGARRGGRRRLGRRRTAGSRHACQRDRDDDHAGPGELPRAARLPTRSELGSHAARTFRHVRLVSNRPVDRFAGRNCDDSTMSPPVGSVTSFIDQHSHMALLLLFAIVALESFGLPLPGETALIACGVLASQGSLSIVAVIAVAALAAAI